MKDFVIELIKNHKNFSVLLQIEKRSYWVNKKVFLRHYDVIMNGQIATILAVREIFE